MHTSGKTPASGKRLDWRPRNKGPAPSRAGRIHMFEAHLIIISIYTLYIYVDICVLSQGESVLAYICNPSIPSNPANSNQPLLQFIAKTHNPPSCRLQSTYTAKCVVGTNRYTGTVQMLTNINEIWQTTDNKWFKLTTKKQRLTETKPAATCSAVNVAWVDKTCLFEKGACLTAKQKSLQPPVQPYTWVGVTNP